MITGIIRGMRGSALVLVLVLAGCAGSGHFVDEGLHVVDGVQMTAEKACAPGDCVEELRAARIALRLPESVVVTRVLLAGWPRAWVDGQHGDLPVLLSVAAFRQPQPVVLELADGTRRAVVLGCGHDPSPRYEVPPYTCAAAAARGS